MTPCAPNMRRILSFVCLLGMVGSWIAMAELIQALQQNSKEKYNKVWIVCDLVNLISLILCYV